MQEVQQRRTQEQAHQQLAEHRGLPQPQADIAADLGGDDDYSQDEQELHRW
ncbi:MAG: hypothetical protein M5R40_19395 [Anaerolineae bacterium]|nr:hypothetical protein [Anaerolineae bacterium]